MDEKVILVGIPRKDFPGGLKVWCPFCHEWHLHGIQNEKDAHKVAHCSGDSPLRDKGYYVRKLSKIEYKQIADAIPEMI